MPPSFHVMVRHWMLDQQVISNFLRVFSFACDLDLFVMVEVLICLMFVIHVKCNILVELALWLRLELGLSCLPCKCLKTGDTSALIFDWVGRDISSDNAQTPWRSWCSSCSNCCTIFPDSSERILLEDERISHQNTRCWPAAAHWPRKTYQ